MGLLLKSLGETLKVFALEEDLAIASSKLSEVTEIDTRKSRLKFRSDPQKSIRDNINGTRNQIQEALIAFEDGESSEMETLCEELRGVGVEMDLEYSPVPSGDKKMIVAIFISHSIGKRIWKELGL